MKARERVRRQIARLLILVVAGCGAVAARQQDHAMPGQTGAPGGPQNALAALCVESQQRAVAIVDQVSRRVEAARRSESPTELRSAIDDLQAAMNQMRSVLRSCSAPPDLTPISRPSGTAPPSNAVSAVDHAAMGHTAPAPQTVAV